MNKKSLKKHNYSGFTLIELIITLAIISILAVMLLPKTKHTSDIRDTQYASNKKLLETTAVNYEKTFSSNSLSSTELATKIYNALATQDAFTTMVNAYDKSKKGVGVDVTSTPNLTTGKAVYILISNPTTIPAGTVYYVVNKITINSDSLITSIPNSVAADNIQINESILSNEPTKPAPGQSVAPPTNVANDCYEIWYVDQLPALANAGTIKKAKIMRNLDFSNVDDYINPSNYTLYTGGGYTPSNICIPLLEGNNKTITSTLPTSIFDTITSTVQNLDIIRNYDGPSLTGVFANKTVHSTILNVNITGSIKSNTANAPLNIGFINTDIGSYISNLTSTVDYTIVSSNYSGNSFGTVIGFINSEANSSETILTNLDISGTVSTTGYKLLGGIFGRTSDSNNSKVTVTHSDINITIDSGALGTDTGGIAAYANSYIFDNNTVVISYTASKMFGGLLAKSSYLNNTLLGQNSIRHNSVELDITLAPCNNTSSFGGLVGESNSALYIYGNSVQGSITGPTLYGRRPIGIGGLVGSTVLSGNNSLITESNTTSANIATNSGNIGGLVGITNQQYKSISDAVIAPATLAGTINVGGIVGNSNNTITVKNPIVSCSKITCDSYAGGIIGKALDTVTDNSISSAKVNTDFTYYSTIGTGNLYIGGIAGYYNGTVSKSYAVANVTTYANYIGGILGSSSSSTISDSFYNGTITPYVPLSPAFIAGITPSSKSSITNCYAVINVGNGAVSDGISYSTSETSCYFYSPTATCTKDSVTTPSTQTDIKTQSKYINWDFTNTWKFDTAVSPYPILIQ